MDKTQKLQAAINNFNAVLNEFSLTETPIELFIVGRDGVEETITIWAGEKLTTSRNG